MSVCKKCGEDTTNYLGGHGECANCWEVEKRLEKYLQSEHGRKFVREALGRINAAPKPTTSCPTVFTNRVYDSPSFLFWLKEEWGGWARCKTCLEFFDMTGQTYFDVAANRVVLRCPRCGKEE